jgi:hypothetical protein
MKKKLLKVGGTTVAVLVLGYLGLQVWMYRLDDGICRETATSELKSPDGNHKATTWQLTCTLLDPPFTSVYLSHANYQFTWRGWWKPFPKQRPVFTAERMGDEVHVKWSHNNTLLISCPFCRPQDVSDRHTQWKHVRIEYDLPRFSQEK